MVADHNTQAISNTNLFKYNGKEQEEFLDWYNYGARFYDPTIGRFTTIDPIAENYVHQNSFVYASNNPILSVDFNGYGPITGGPSVTVVSTHVSNNRAVVTQTNYSTETINHYDRDGNLTGKSTITTATSSSNIVNKHGEVTSDNTVTTSKTTVLKNAAGEIVATNNEISTSNRNENDNFSRLDSETARQESYGIQHGELWVEDYVKHVTEGLAIAQTAGEAPLIGAGFILLRNATAKKLSKTLTRLGVPLGLASLVAINGENFEHSVITSVKITNQYGFTEYDTERNKNLHAQKTAAIESTGILQWPLKEVQRLINLIPY